MREGSPTAADELELELLLEAIYRRFHYDFRRYSRSSLKRRFEDALATFGCVTLSGLQERLLHDEAAFPALIRTLTVPVSDLFRDPAFFSVLRRDIVPILETYPLLRIWIAGCSTGEEAYSFAILLEEEGLLERAIVYATDINPDSLRSAETGVYPLERLERFVANHRLSGAKKPLSDHFAAAYGSVIFDHDLRQKIVFSDHSLSTDKGFAEMQLISCRNVLIYFDAVLQSRALALFRDSLCHRGFLGLGAHETLGLTDREQGFAEMAEHWYRRC